MKQQLARAFVAAWILGMSGVAQAVPIFINYTGTVTGGYEGTPIGAAVSGGFTLETDRFVSVGPPLSGVQYGFIDRQPTDLTTPLGFLDVGGTHFEVPTYSQNYALINFADGCQPSCNTGWAENFNVGAYSQDPVILGYTGQRRSFSLSILNIYDRPSSEFPWLFEGYDAFDGATSLPLDVLSLPLVRTSGSYFENIFDCVAGTCVQGATNLWTFSIETVTRGVIQPTEVPEPGTLALFAAALFGCFAIRRRSSRRRPSRAGR